MRRIKQQTIKQKKLLAENHIILAYVFGSETTGFKHKESDVDIAVLLDKKVKQDEYFKKTLEFSSLFTKIFPAEQIHINILNNATPLLKHFVLQEGKLIFCANDQEKIKFHIDTVHLWEDTKHFREMQWEYLKQRIKQNVFGE